MTDREPARAPDRLSDVRPSPLPASDHAGHDRWLVVRFTTDPADLTRDETIEARALLTSCPDCAALASDLEVISRATATSVVPRRPRDFRLTPEQAASAQGGVLDRIRRWLGSAGAFAVRPLAGAALTIGLVIAIASPMLRPATTAPDEAVAGIAPKASVAATAAATEVPGPQNPEAYSQLAGESPQADVVLRMGTAPASSPSPTGETGDTAAEARTTAGTPAPDEAAAPAGATQNADAAAPDDTTFALILLGIGLAVTGLIVLVLSWFARRWQDPLLR